MRAAFASLSLALFIAPPALAEEIAAESRVTAAVIYPDAASITRTAIFSTEAGRHVVVLEDLPERLDASSLRLAGVALGGASFEIVSAERGQVSREASEEENAEREAIEAQIREVEWRRRAAEDALAAAQERRAYATRFRDAVVSQGAEGHGGAEWLDRLERWQGAWSAIAVEARDADAAARDAERQMQDLDEELVELYADLGRVGPATPDRTALKVSIAAEAPIEDARLDITYLSREARWEPLYDLKLDTVDPEDAAAGRRLEMIRRAAVRQYTGEAWSGVRLTLSTARPSGRLAGRTPPERIARIYDPVPLGQARGRVGGLVSEDAPAPPAAAAPMEPEPSIEEQYKDGFAQGYAAEADEAESPADRLRVSRQQPPRPAQEIVAAARFEGETVVYELPEPLDVEGDGDAALALINAEIADVTLELRASPELDETAYLYAIIDAAPAAIPPGRASIFRDGAYLGQFNLGYVAPGDEAPLPFGPVEGVRIDYSVVERLRGAQGVFTTSTTNSERFRIEARNLTDEAYAVALYAGMPVTEDERIDISFNASEDPDEEGVEGRRGVVAWRFDLEPGAERTIDYGWDLAWPEGEQVIFE